MNLTERSFGFYNAAFFAIIVLRYFLVAGGIYLLLYVPACRWLSDRHSSAPNSSAPLPGPNAAQRRLIQQDILLSMQSAIVFAFTCACIMSLYCLGFTRLYLQVQSSNWWFDWWYIGLSYIFVLILQDTYFYFTHRLFHHPRLFSWFHQGHHRSRHPTPWTSFAFDPLEAIAQALFLAFIVFTIPLHFITIIAVLITMTVWAVMNHLGIERLPVSFPHHWLGKWFIGPAHHSVHHCKYSMHYGLYFTFWDKLLGTQDPKYEAAYGQCASRPHTGHPAEES
ncbi:sterol desaturase family protein [Leptolyngbya sp. AN02str]|uniref:sterol desaturase family protein n=1 Tax=Leptolyngbya sp. AN02str TaxID=3423363 RepID=UPI003D3168F2